MPADYHARLKELCILSEEAPKWIQPAQLILPGVQDELFPLCYYAWFDLVHATCGGREITHRSVDDET